MKTDKEWEDRARKLFSQEWGEGWTMFNLAAAEMALQLGREMAEEAAREEAKVRVAGVRDFAQRAADARAEEIARQCTEGLPSIVYGNSYGGGLYDAAKIARSTITKPKEPEYDSGIDLARDKDATVLAVRFTPETEAAIRADERERAAKRIEACEDYWHNAAGKRSVSVATAAALARAGEPKTRELVLEDALREIQRSSLYGSDKERIATRALEWTP